MFAEEAPVTDTGRCLEAAQHADRAWRRARRARALRALRRATEAYGAVTNPLARLLLIAAVAFVVGVITFAVGIIAVVAERAGAESVTALGTLILTGALGGIALLLLLAGSSWLLRAGAEALVQGWADRHAIDLDSDRTLRVERLQGRGID